MTSKTHILLGEEYEDQKSHFKPRWPRHSFAKILILSALFILVLFLTVIYYGEFFQTEDVLHGTMHINVVHAGLESPSNLKTGPLRKRIRKQLFEELYPAEILKKWSKFKLHKYQRRIRVRRDLINDAMIDPMEVDFNDLRTKIRDKRTIIELSKLENDYAKCKKESLSHSECMDTFIKMYKIAKDISDKMEKMKQIFRDSEIHLHANSVSSSMEKYLDKKKPSKKKNYDTNVEHISSEFEDESTLKPKVTTEEGVEESGINVSNLTTEPVKYGLKKLIQDDQDELIPSADGWVEKDKLPHFEEESEKTVDVLPVTSNASVNESRKDQIENLNLEITTTPSITDNDMMNPKTDGISFSTVHIHEINLTTLEPDDSEVTTETQDSFKIDPLDMIRIDILNTSTKGFSDDYVEPFTPAFEKIDSDFVTSKSTTNPFSETAKIQTSTTLQEEMSDLDFKILNESTTARNESFHTSFVDLIEQEKKVSEVTEVMFDALNQTTEAVKHILKKLIQTDGDELIPSADVWVEVNKVPHVDAKSKIVPVTSEIPVNETSVFDQTTFSMSGATSGISSEPDYLEVTTDTLDSFKVDPLDMIKIENWNTTTKGFNDDFVEPITKAFEEMDSDFVTSKITTARVDEFFTENSNTDKVILEERSSDKLHPGMKTVLSNYTTDVEFTYNAKCLATTTVSSTTPYGNSAADDCKIQDSSTEGPIIRENAQERHPSSKELTTTLKSLINEHPLDNPSSKENMLDDVDDKSNILTTTTKTTAIEEKWIKKFKEGSQEPSTELTEFTNTNSELIDTFGDLDEGNVNKFGPKINPSKMAEGGNNKQLLTLCDYLAKQTRSKVTSSPEQNDDITPSPNIQFTSRGPGFPVTGETMKASAQFFINPNFGVPSIPVCFYITPATFRMMLQPFWSPFFGMHGMGGGNIGGSGNSGSGGLFIVPPSFNNMQNSGNFFGQTSPSGSGSQGNIPNIFSKSASSQQQQKHQQFFCTYMQNGGKQSGSVGNRGFNNVNFKLRNSSGNVSSPTEIIYSSYWNKLPGYHGSNLGEEDRFQCPIEGDVPCYGGHECVPEKKWCDNTVDCSDGSDEAACTCRKRILESRICDGYQDCPLGEDEIGCFGCESFKYSCYDNEEEFQRANRSTLAMCYSSAERCDGVRNCINGRDEMGCNLIVGDLTHHMSHAVSGSTGYLYRNFHGEWYPVCNNAQRWAREACSEELGVLIEEPSVTFQEVELSGPFIESHHSGGAHFAQSCQKRERDILSDITAHVRCPQAKCGIIQELTSPLLRSRRRRRRSESLIDDASRIVGGTYSKPLQWPFVVAIYRNGDFHCGGTIFSEQWIITAAHCTINFQKYFYEVRAGLLRRSSFSSATQIHHVTHVVVHQMYERRTMKNDLALMRIDTPLRFNRWVKPICLPDIGRTTMGTDWIWGPEVNTICTVVGWGAVREKGPGSDRLKEVQLPIRRRCSEKDDQEAEDICAGEVVGGRDACQGDSGGPLFCRSVSNNNEWYLAGVVSHGNGCARAKEFGVYTRVALYLDWIAMAIKSEFLPKVQPKQLCPGYVCIWGGKRCIPQSKRCDRLVDCLGGEDEVGCIYNYIPDVGATAAGANASTTSVMDEADQDGATTTETDAEVDGKNFNGGTDTEPSSLEEIPNDNMAITSTDDATTNASPTLFTDTISEKVETIADTPAMPSMTTPTDATPPEPITELNPSPSSFLPPTSEDDQSKLKDLAVKFLDTIEFQIASTETEGSDDENTNTTPLTIASSVTSVTGFGDFKADLGDVSSENPTTVHKRENATEKDTSSTVKLKTMPKKIAQKFVCEKIPQIIDIGNRCDRISDCEDGTDENGCTCRQYLKGPLNILICDGKIDCEDFTDEDDCGNCTATEFLCPMSKTCISSKSRCDEIVDCQFKEDEKDCFALTNGREIHLDSHKQPKLQSAGIFSRNHKGQWRVVCAHDTQFHQHVAKTAEEVCSLLGFTGTQFYNTTQITQDIIVPIDPDLSQMGFPKERHAIGDSVHFTKHFTHHFNIPLPSSPRSERLEKSIGNCEGLYIECVPKSNGTKPLKTLTAGNEISPKTLDVQSSKPNKKTTSISELFSDKKEEILNKLNKLIETKKTVVVHDKLYEGVEKIHWPWLVSVYVNGELWCIGILVDKHWVLVHEACYYGVSLDTEVVTVLLGGGKSKQTLHKSPHEQIKRVDCFDAVDNSDVILLHLDNAAHFTRHVLPTFLPDMILTEKDKVKTSNKCMSVVHDKFGGIKVTPTMEKPEATMCSKSNELLCYQWDPKAILDFKLKHFGMEDEEEGILSSSLADKDEEVKSLMDFCKDIEDNINSYNQGVIVCREENTGWYPMAYYTFNATDCNNMKQPFAVRTLDKVYGFIQEIIDQPKCKDSVPRPRPHCPALRCPLGNCLLPDQMCNGKVDCHDGSDEEKEYCRLHRNECKPSELKCRSSGKCIPKTKFCDNISDCEDLTDEPSICSCFTYLQATDPSKICDGIRNCWDKSDESSVLCNCTSDRFPCGSSRSECIPRDFVCDKEPDCPNGEDERYCYGIEQPIKTYSTKAHTSGYGQVTEQSYGVWHTKCFPRHQPPDSNEVSEICRKLGYHSRRKPSYRLIDDNADIVAAKRVENGEFTKSSGKYRDATKAVVINKFSPLHLNEDLTLIMKPSRPIAKLVKWNQTDSSNCYRLEVKCN